MTNQAKRNILRKQVQAYLEMIKDCKEDDKDLFDIMTAEEYKMVFDHFLEFTIDKME